MKIVELRTSNAQLRTKSFAATSKSAVERSAFGVRLLRTAALVAAACGALCASLAAAQTSNAPALGSQMAPLLDELAALTRQGEWGVGEWARGSVLALRLFNYGPNGVPYMRGKFLRTRDPNEAFLSGAYVAMHGQAVDHKRVRSDLETNPGKRTWLKSMVGDSKAMTASLEQGQQWQQAVDYFPSLGGCRGFCQVCLQSQDALVRRAGLYWGFWVSDLSYWRAVQAAAREDPDALTRKFAVHLYRLRSGE